MRPLVLTMLAVLAIAPPAHAAGEKAAGKVAGKAVFAAPADSPASLLFPEARAYCEGLDVLGHSDWRLPDRRELALLHDRRKAVGGFKGGQGGDDALSYLTALSEQSWGGAYYWSSEQEGSQGLGMDFATGQPIRLSLDGSSMPNRAAARCVRTSR